MNQSEAEAQGRQRPPTLEDAVVAAILEAARGMRFGQITATVHDGRIVQVDRTERRRLNQESSGGQ